MLVSLWSSPTFSRPQSGPSGVKAHNISGGEEGSGLGSGGKLPFIFVQEGKAGRVLKQDGANRGGSVDKSPHK